MLVQYKGKLQLFSEESYLPSTKIISKQNVPIVEKGQRTNNDNLLERLDVNNIIRNTPFKETISESRAIEFQHYFSEFIKYAGAYSERNENFDVILEDFLLY